MCLANFANDASSMVHLRSSPWHIPCQPYGRLSIVVHYPSVSIRAAQSGLQSAPACRMQWVCHHLFRSYDRNLSNIANIRLHSVSEHTYNCKDRRLWLYISRTLHLFVPIGALWWYRFKWYDGTECSAMMVPIHALQWYRFADTVNWTDHNLWPVHSFLP